MINEIDPDADRPVYKQVADIIRDQIAAGILKPGQRVRAEMDYVEQYGVSRDTVRRAMSLLRGEGLIITTSRGSRVRPEQERDAIVIGAGERVTARMPNPEERLRLGVKEGVPVFVVHREGERDRLFPSDRWEVTGR